MVKSPSWLKRANRARKAIGQSPLANARRYKKKSFKPRAKKVYKKSGIATVSKVRGYVGGLSTSLCVRKARISPQVRAMERCGAPNVFTTQYAFRNNTTPGLQGYNSFAFNDTVALKLLPTTLNIVGSTQTRPYRYVLESLIGNVTMTNNSTAGVELEIYDIVLKRDLPNPVNVTQQGYTWRLPAGQVYPDTMWAYFSNMDNGAAPSTTAPYPANSPGASPFDCNIWKNYFKVTKRTHVMLAQGGTHRHGVISQPNALLDSTLFNQALQSGADAASSSSLSGMRGLTTYVMVVQKGLPSSTNNAEPDTASVTLASSSIDFVQDFRYKYTYVVDNIMAAKNFNNLVTGGKVSIINTGSGAVEDQAYTVQT